MLREDLEVCFINQLEMKFGIVGNREGWEQDFVINKIREIISIERDDTFNFEVEIISGGASGIDYIAKHYAIGAGYIFREFLPDNNEPIPQRYFNRNKKIAKECDILIAFDKKVGRSGTKNTIRYAKELNKEVIIIDSHKN